MTTDERLENLERALATSQRRIRWILSVGCLVLTGLLATASIPKAPDAFTAKNFVVVDDNGKAIAVFGAAKEGPLLKMNDRNGKTRALLLVTKDGPSLCLRDETGRPRVGLSMLNEGARLQLLGDQTNSHAILVAGKDAPQMELVDEKGKTLLANP